MFQRFFGRHDVVALLGDVVVTFLYFGVGFDGHGVDFPVVVEAFFEFVYFVLQLGFGAFDAWLFVQDVVDADFKLDAQALGDGADFKLDVVEFVLQVVDQDLQVRLLAAQFAQAVFHFHHTRAGLEVHLFGLGEGRFVDTALGVGSL